MTSTGKSFAPLVSGRAFRGILRYLKDHQAPGLVSDVIASTRAPAVFDQPMRSMGWYPYTAYRDFLVAADRVAGSGDGAFCRTIGANAGQRDISTVLRIYVALASPERLIRACSKVWPSYYANAGRMEALSWAPDNTLLRIYDFPEMHPFHCRLMEGWMISTMNSLGLQVDGASETQCSNTGSAYHEFVCTWKKA